MTCGGGRAEKDKQTLTGLLCIDVDGADNPGCTGEELKNRVSSIAEVVYCALSASGKDSSPLPLPLQDMPKPTTSCITGQQRTTPTPPSPPVVRREPPMHDTIEVVDNLVGELEATCTNITESYDEWVQIGIALADLGEAGRDYYHRVSALSSKNNHEETDKKFNQLAGKVKSAHVATFIYRARQALPCDPAFLKHL